MSVPPSLQQRLDFIGFSADDQEALRGAQAVVMAHMPAALAGFYARIAETPEISRFFTGPAHVAAASARQHAHWGNITTGRFDESYQNATHRIGTVHAQIGLEPRWYIGGYALVLEKIVQGLLATDGSKARFGLRKKNTGGDLAKTVNAVLKAALLDMELVISVYLERADASRKVQEDAMAMERQKIVACVASSMAALAQGDLTNRIADDLPPQYESLKTDFNIGMDALHAAVQAVVAAGAGLASATGEIAQASDDLSRRTEQQAATLEQTAAALDEITTTVRKTADGAKLAQTVVSQTKNEAELSDEVVRQAVTAMASIEESSQKIGQIIGVIDEIAFQTNLLALNAGVEAARAGDAGRGFAVVASEVRALAQRSAEAAKEIKTLISTSARQVDAGVKLVGETGEALSRIMTQVGEINGVVAQIASSAQEQAQGLGEVNTAINQMDQVTQQNAAMVEQSTAASHALTQETENLVRVTGHFRLAEAPQTSVSAATPPMRRPPPRPQRAASGHAV